MTLMKRCTHSGYVTLVAIGIALFAGPICKAAGQNPALAAQTPAGGEGVRGDGGLSIDVMVADKLGHAVRGLKAGDFTLLDNRDPRKLTGFRAVDGETRPADQVHVVIVVDMINTSFSTVAREREQLGEFLKLDGGRLGNPTSIAVLADGGLKVENGSSLDGNALLAGFSKSETALRTIGGNTGFYGAAERMEMSLNQLGQLAAYEAGQPGRKLLLVIGPGWPMLPWAGTEADLKQRAWVFNSIVQLTNGLREGHIALYCLDPFDLGRTDPFFYQGYLKPIAAVKDAEYPDLALQVIAEHSGGQVLINGRDIAGELKQAVRDAGAYYELTFAGAPGDRPNEYHALRVTVDKPDVTIRAAAGYYARVQAETGKKAR